MCAVRFSFVENVSTAAPSNSTTNRKCDGCPIVRPIRVLRTCPRSNAAGSFVVERLLVGSQLDEVHRAFAPVPDGLDPNAGPALIPSSQILVALKIPLALHQAEAARP